MIRQTTGYGCGMYAVANALDSLGFVTDRRLEASKTGNTIPQLNRWLAEDWEPYGLDVLYYDHFGEKLPDAHLSYKTDTAGALLPILLEVESSNKISHMVGGRLDHEGKLLLMDSLEKFPRLTTLKYVNDNVYSKVRGVFAFTYLDGGQWMVLQPKNEEVSG